MDPELQAFLWKFLDGLLAAILPVLATALTAWLVQKARQIGANLTSDQQWIVDYIVQTVVNAAEQAGAAGLIENKKEYAMTLAVNWLDEKKIKVDIARLEGMIEASVWTEIEKDKA